MKSEPDLKLGLIGDHIARSRAPMLHKLAGAQNGLQVQYDLLVPKELAQDFDTVFDRCAAGGYRCTSGPSYRQSSCFWWFHTSL